MRRSLVILLMCLSLTACSKEEEPVETTAPPPPPPTAAHVEDINITLDRWGDEGLVFSIKDDEAIQSYTDVQIKVLPNVNQFDYVQVDYIQGVSLNDFGKAYWAGYPDETKSEYESNGFTTDTTCFKFVRTEKNSTLMVSGPSSLSSFVQDIYERLGGVDVEPEPETVPEETQPVVTEAVETESQSEGGTE